jgi:recombination protein U
MGVFHSRGLRGNTLEELINITNAEYLKDALAAVQKIPTPITPTEIDKSRGVITLGYFEKKSTVDYIGNVQGIPICFDAKETSLKSLPIQNIHPHQIEFMDSFCKQDGIAFLIVYFSAYDEYYLIDFATIKDFYERSLKGERKSIPYQSLNKKYIIKRKDKFLLHYLETLNVYMLDMEDKI